MKYVNSINFFDYDNIEIVYGTCKHTFPIHIHINLCIGIITSGFANLIINGKKSLLSTGNYYVIPPYTPHSLSSVNNCEFSYKVFCFKNFYSNLSKNEVISFVLENIRKHDKKLNIETLSKSVFISKYHFIRKFKSQVGVTPYQFYINEKVKKIRQGLQIQLSLSDLTFNLGFSDESHLCNTFKKHVGITPKQYVKSYYRV